jgi:hypothetical protein
MRAALLAEPVLTADESPVEVVGPATDPDTGAPVSGSPHVMVIRTPDERLSWLTGLVARCYDVVIAGWRAFAGHLIVDGNGACQRLLTQAGGLLAGYPTVRRSRAAAGAGQWPNSARARPGLALHHPPRRGLVLQRRRTRASSQPNDVKPSPATGRPTKPATDGA